jgi:hypothetical protein
MRAAALESLFPLLDLKYKGAPYADPIEEMTDESQAQLDRLVAFRAPGWVPGRDARFATRPAAAERMVLSFRELHGHTRIYEGRTPPTLPDLVAPENVLPWIDFLQNDRGLFRESIAVTVGRVHSIACKHEIFKGLEFEWLLERVREVPKERRYKRRQRKQDKAVPDQVLAQLPGMLRADSEAPGLSVTKVARLRHDESLVLLLLLALRQRNVRDCAIDVNFVWHKITLKMKKDLDLPECVLAEWDRDRHRDFLMLVYTEIDTKANRWEIVVIPMADANTIDEFERIHRRQLVPNEGRKHGELFCNSRGDELSEEAFRRRVRGITKTYLGKSISPHLWRSIFGARGLRLAALGIGGGLLHVQRRLFQAAPETMQSYLDLYYALPGILALDREFSPYTAID